MVAVVTRIMLVFADALPHMPEHRRVPVLTQLVATLGPAHFLWVLMLLLFKLRATDDKDKVPTNHNVRGPGSWLRVACFFASFLLYCLFSCCVACCLLCCMWRCLFCCLSRWCAPA